MNCPGKFTIYGFQVPNSLSEEVPNVKLDEVGKEMSIIDVHVLYAECQVRAPEV